MHRNNYTASTTAPERIQVGLSYFTTHHFGYSILYPGSPISRISAECYAPPLGDNFTYWVVYDAFQDGNLDHSMTLGYGLESRPDVATITLSTSAAIILLSFLVSALVIFGRKLENSKYGQKFEQITKAY